MTVILGDELEEDGMEGGVFTGEIRSVAGVGDST